MASIVEDKKKYTISLAVLFALIAVTFFLLFRNNSLPSVLPLLQYVNYWYVLAGIVAVFLYICGEALNICQISRSLGIFLPYRRCLKYGFVGFYFSAITPGSSGGQPAQVYYMKKDGVDIAHSSVTLLTIITAYQIVMLIYASVSMCFKARFVLGHLEDMGILLAFGVSFNLISLALLFFALFSHQTLRRFVLWLIGVFARARVLRNPERAVEGACRQLEEYHRSAAYMRRHPALLLRVFLVNFAEMTAMFSVPYFVYRAFGLSDFHYVDILTVQAILNVAVSALPLPGSVGASEGSFLILFRTFFGAQLLVPAMLLSRVISFYFYLLVSGAVSITAYAYIVRRGRGPRELGDAAALQSDRNLQ